MNTVYFKSDLGFIAMSQTDWEACAAPERRPQLLDVNQPDDGFLAWLNTQGAFAFKKFENGQWIEDKAARSEHEATIDANKRAAFQAELDARLDAAVAIASPLDYANKRKKLPVDKAARLAAFNNYIDQLAALEYSEAVEWPVQPE